MSDDDRISKARELMEAFARETGLASDAPPRRYLWTDAFAVCNLLGLHEATGEERPRRLALELIDRVHRTLGRHRDDDPRSGWISGLPEEEGARHPTAGGLRIGKPLPERGPDEPYRPREEWDRDGQYYHYLTKWMVALDRAWRVTGEDDHHRWAAELAAAAQRGFLTSAGGERHLAWKMSIDLSRPLVPSAGQHDPLDGLVAVSTLRASAPEGEEERIETLDGVIAGLRELCRGERWVTDDPLGAGGLLVAAYRSARLRAEGRLDDGELFGDVLEAAVTSLEATARPGLLEGAPETRLAFRELGLAIGLRAARRLVDRGREALAGPGVAAPGEMLRHLRDRLPLADAIEGFWLHPEHRDARTWREHADISRVMLATSLAPAGYLGG